jgi:hypothetical protein
MLHIAQVQPALRQSRGQADGQSGGKTDNPWKMKGRMTMAATLDDLLEIDGVVAAGEFTADGKVVDYRAKMDMSPEMADMTAQFCATVTMNFKPWLARSPN